MIYCDTTKSHFGGSQSPVQLYVYGGIVDVIIGKMLFQDDNVNEKIAEKRGFSIFKNAFDAWEANDADAADVATSKYCICLKNFAQVYLVADYLSVGASF